MVEFVSTLPAWIDPRTMPTCDCWSALGANACCPHCDAAVRAYEAIRAAHIAALQSEKARADAAEARIAALEAGMRGLVETVVEHTDHYAQAKNTCGLCAALHEASALLNRPADVEADRNG